MAYWNPRDPVWDDVRLTMRYTRYWLHYGWAAFTVLLIVVGAVEGALTR
ncbi:MAG: hypothetical protein M3O35_10255 [Acidobacteriota bacterium]|nr:hypothetical protein [Acidobacteriota bacterium]